MEEKKTNISQRGLIEYLKNSFVELKKVDWPTKKKTWDQTLVVIGVSAGTAIFLGALDFIFGALLKTIIS